MIDFISKKILHFFSKQTLLQPMVLLGFSGGADSTFLFFVLLKLHNYGLLKLVCLHINHGWRADSNIDADFCRQLCLKNNIEFIEKHASELNFKNNGSLEELGRKIRRYFFQQVKVQVGAEFVFLAHHLDDQVETFFIRSIRGSSLKGLAGIAQYSTPYFRPLLSLRKSQIITFLKNENIEFIYDQSNDSDLFLRNRIRNYLVPEFEKIDSRAIDKINDTMTLLQKESNLLEFFIESKFEELIITKDNQVGLDKKRFWLLPELLQTKLLQLLMKKNNVEQTVSQSFFDELIRFLKSNKSKKHSFNNWQLHKSGGVIFIVKLA